MRGFAHESTHNESKEWYTPKCVFDALAIDFDLDPCSPGPDVVPWIPAKEHLTWRDNGLGRSWQGGVWMNPPYGSDTPRWMEKLARHGNGVALVFSRTDTQWFHKYVPLADAICFVKGRVQFVKADDAMLYANGEKIPNSGCGAGSMLIAYGEENARALYRSGIGLTLPAGRHLEMFRAERGFAGGGYCPYENLPQNAESGQSLF